MARLIICADCGEEKPHKAKGLCNLCYKRSYMSRWRQSHKEELLTYKRRWREANPDYYHRYYQEHRIEIMTYKRHWREEHREEILAKHHRWRQANPEKIAGYIRRWQQTNQGRKNIIWACRQARKRRLPDTLTLEQAELLFRIGRVMYPGEKLHLDHIVPISKGGGTTRANMHAIPSWLNLLKHTLLPEEAYKQECLL